MNTNIRFVLLAIICTVELGINYCFDNPTPLAVQIQEELKITSTQFTMLYSAYCLPNVFVPLFFGWLVDRIGARKVLIITGSIIVVGQYVFYKGSQASNYTFLLIGRFLFGIGGESVIVSTSTIEATWFKGKELSFAIGADYSLANLATFFNDFFEPMVYNATQSLSYVFWIGVLICLYSLFASGIVYAIDSKSQQAPENDTHIYSPHEAFSLGDISTFSWDFWLVCIAGGLGSSVWIVFSSIASEFLQTRFGFSLQLAGTLLGLEALAIVISVPFIGHLLDKCGHKIIFASAAMILLFGCLIFLFYIASSFIEVLLVILTSGMCNGAIYSTFWSLVSLTVNPNALGTAYGIAQGFSNCIQAVFPVIIGKLIDTAISKPEGVKRAKLLILFLVIVSLSLTILLFPKEHEYDMQGRERSPGSGVTSEMRHMKIEAPPTNYGI